MMYESRPAWWEAVTAEFVYEQGQVNSLNAAHFTTYDQQTSLPYDNNAYHHNSSASHSPIIYSNQQSPSDRYSVGSNADPYNTGPPSPEYLAAGYPHAGVYAPCDGPRPWNYNYCYGYYGEPACPMVNMVDMEDFM